MNLTPHFTLEELTVTETGLDNTPPSEYIPRLQKLAEFLEKVRAFFGGPIKINSGFRSEAVNAKIGGSTTSAHSLAMAADTVPPGDLLAAYKAIAENASLMAGIDQLIFEQKQARGGYTKWIHIGIGHGPNGDLPLRHSLLIYSPKTNGKYLPFDESFIV